MKLFVSSVCVAFCLVPVASHAQEIDWRQFRGPGGQGVSAQTGLPLKWSADQNILWKTPLPGFGASSPITVGQHIFVTCYSGYGLDPKVAGDPSKLRVHLLCIDRDRGNILWDKGIPAAVRPNDFQYHYASWMRRHGYASSTPVSDGKAVYAFFGPNGVFAFDLEGKQLWQVSVGTQTHGFGTGASPILNGGLLIVNASIESGCLVAIDKATGKEAWRAGDIKESWSTPVLVDAGGGKQELVVTTQDRLLALDPTDGKPLWNTAGSKPPRYVCPSPVAAGDTVYAVHGYFGPAVAVRGGGRGDVTGTHQLWSVRRGSNVSSPVYHDGHLYWMNEQGVAFCVDAKKGEQVYQERLVPPAGDVYASPVVADGKIYYVSRDQGTFVLPARPKFEVLAHSMIATDDSTFNASPVVSGKGILLRSDRMLYYIGNK